LANLFANETVVGLGDGRGVYRRRILNTNKVRKYDAYDGAPNINNITGGQVICSFEIALIDKSYMTLYWTAIHQHHYHK